MKVTVVDYRVIPSPDAKRLGKKDILQVVEIDGGARFAIRLPEENSGDDALKAEIKRQMTERGANVGKVLEI